MYNLTKRQKEIFNYIKSFIEKNDYSPTLEELRRHFKLKALSGVYQHINTLIDKGYVTRDENATRGLSIRQKERSDTMEIPLVGTIAAGQPIEPIETRKETIAIARDTYFDPEQLYALKVAGDSMIEDGIFDGDMVIIKKQENAENGQTVVAIIDENEATLKKIYREKNKFRLQPANQNILPIYRTQVEIRGVVVKIIRNFKDEPQKTKQFKTIDLFAGVGGIRL